MGIVAFCPQGHRVKVKDSLAGKKGVCPVCQARFRIPGRHGPTLPTARVLSLDAARAATLPRAVILPLPTVAPTTPPPQVRQDEVIPKARQGKTIPQARPQARQGETPPPTGSRSRLDERPDLAWCVAVPGGSPSPPMTAQEMQAWLDTGLATGEELVWRSDWQEWAPIRLVFPESCG
jgi:hypothetical protein